MTVIKVPKTPKTAFDPDRPAGLLLQSQIEHLEAAVQSRSAAPPRRPRMRGTPSEGQAAAYIAELTRHLDPNGAPPAVVQDVAAAAAAESAPRSVPAAARRRATPRKRATSARPAATGTRKRAQSPAKPARKTARSTKATAAARKTRPRTGTTSAARARGRRK
jgi:hypothetical protein